MAPPWGSVLVTRVEGLCRHSGGQGMALDQQYLSHTRNECERKIFRPHPNTPHQTLGHLATCIIVRLWSFSGMIRLESSQNRGSPGREELGSPRPGQERPISGVCSRATSRGCCQKDETLPLKPRPTWPH